MYTWAKIISGNFVTTHDCKKLKLHHEKEFLSNIPHVIDEILKLVLWPVWSYKRRTASTEYCSLI